MVLSAKSLLCLVFLLWFLGAFHWPSFCCEPLLGMMIRLILFEGLETTKPCVLLLLENPRRLAGKPAAQGRFFKGDEEEKGGSDKKQQNDI